MTAGNGSYSGPFASHDEDRIIGTEWIEHGYKFIPIVEEVDPCIIDGAPQNTCTDSSHEHTTDGGSTPVPGYDIPETGSHSKGGGYVPGSFVDSDRYDIPEGSQRMQPGAPDESDAPTVEPNIYAYQDPNDPGYAIVGGTDLEVLPPGTYAGLPSTEFDTSDGGDYMVVPPDTNSTVVDGIEVFDPKSGV